MVVIGPCASPQGVERRTHHVAAHRAMRGCRDLLADALNVVIGVEQPNRGVDVIQVDDQLSQPCAGVRDFAGDLSTLFWHGPLLVNPSEP
jgi:hypothetical protein